MTSGGRGLIVIVNDEESIYCQTLMDKDSVLRVTVWERLHHPDSPAYMKPFPVIKLDLAITKIIKLIKLPSGVIRTKEFFDFKIIDIDDGVPDKPGLTISYKRFEFDSPPTQMVE